ncbi:MFS transporter [Arthrobacter sp. ERGS1:01]|uniref:MFS transporter n=1 Tax=Arthrobacter sp. ERGS1:01 TaxID=1704044 RepID=UPI001364C72E|nr:MFS transporter [Arthrobacter sp. ERGS1:01]
MKQHSTTISPIDTPYTPNKGTLWLSPVLAAIIFTALVLRPPLTAIGALTPVILSDGGLSATELGFLGSVPLVVFATFSMLVPRLAQRIRMSSLLAAGMAIAFLGSLLRLLPGSALLFLGTGLLAAGLCIGNVVLPLAARRFFPRRIGIITGLYTALMSAGGGIGVVLALPLSDGLGLGWRATLALMGALTSIAGILWIQTSLRESRTCSQQKGTRTTPETSASEGTSRGVILAVGTFFGAQASFFYLVASWLLPLLLGKSVPLPQATIGVGAFSFAGILTCFITPPLALRLLGLTKTVLVLSAFQLVGATMLLLGTGNTAFMGAVLLATGVTGAFSLSFVLFSVKAGSHEATMTLSGKAQATGYMIAAVFPFAIGALHSVTDSWVPAEAAMLGLALLTLGSGIASTRGKVR